MRCHNTTAWKMARLKVHTFILDHGEEDPQDASCNSCHVGTYAQHDCDGCHEAHANMQQVHQEEGILDDTDCIACHPTGVQGEGKRIMDEQGTQDVQGSLPGNSGAELLNLIISQPQVSQDISLAGR